MNNDDRHCSDIDCPNNDNNQCTVDECIYNENLSKNQSVDKKSV
jgi:hypothetical protein